MNEFNEVNRNQALRALVASSENLAGVQIVRGTMTGWTVATGKAVHLPFPWTLDAAIALVRAGRTAGIDTIVWNPDGPGLVLLDADGTVAYRFTTVNPFEMPQVGPAAAVPKRRAAIWIVPPAS